MSEFSRIMNAWNNPGPVPSHHQKMKDKLRREWPTLANALDDKASETIMVGLKSRNGETLARLVEYADNTYQVKFFITPGETYTHHGIKRRDGVWLWFPLPAYQTFSPFGNGNETYTLTATLSKNQYREYMDMWIEHPRD